MTASNNNSAQSQPVKRKGVFGGSKGVWRANRKAPNRNAKDSKEASSSSTLASITDQSPEYEIQWDYDLCRPIYIKKPSLHDHAVMSFGEDEHEHGDDRGKKSGGKQATARLLGGGPLFSSQQTSTSVGRTLFLKAPLKRSKKYGRGKHSPRSFLLAEELNQTPFISSASSPESYSSSANGNAEDGMTRTTSFAENKGSVVDVANTVIQQTRRKSTRKRHQQGKEADAAFFHQARRYFDEIDATELPICDSSQWPSPVTSKTTRTSRSVDLTCPCINQEYQQHVAASGEAGVTPFSIQVFAAGRRDFFHKGQLFDGFFDDDP